MKKRIIIGISVLLCILFVACANNQNEEDYDYEVVGIDREGEYDLTYDGLTHRLIICEPEDINESTDIIIALHGYGGTASDMRQMTKLDEDALDRNYIVVYVTGAVEKNDPTSSYGWNASWNSGLRDSDKDDEGLLVALTHYIKENYQLESGKCFVVGFSNGAFMTYRLAVSRPDTFAACASVAGKMPKSVWENKAKKTSGMLQINGLKDNVVPMKQTGTAGYSDDPAIEDVIDYFAKVNKCKEKKREQLSDKALLTKYEGKEKWQIWTIYIDEMEHCWPSMEQAGFNVNEEILNYFDLFR